MWCDLLDFLKLAMIAFIQSQDNDYFINENIANW